MQDGTVNRSGTYDRVLRELDIVAYCTPERYDTTRFSTDQMNLRREYTSRFNCRISCNSNVSSQSREISADIQHVGVGKISDVFLIKENTLIRQVVFEFLDIPEDPNVLAHIVHHVKFVELPIDVLSSDRFESDLVVPVEVDDVHYLITEHESVLLCLCDLSVDEFSSIPIDQTYIVAADVEDVVEDEEPVTTLSIEDLELSVRAYNCLKRASINSMKELLQKSEHDLLNIKNFGKKSSDEVIERLAANGLNLAPNPEILEEEIVL